MKRIYSICLIVFLCLFQVTPAFASVATSSDWTLDEDTVTSSDWNYFTPFDWDAYYQDYGIAPLAAGSVPSVSNTISYTGVTWTFAYANTSGQDRFMNGSVDSNGHLTFSKPSDYQYAKWFCVYLHQPSFPTPGTYDVSFKFASNTVLEYARGFFYSTKRNLNASSQNSRLYISTAPDFQQFSGDYYLHTVASVGGGLTSIEFGVDFNKTSLVSFNVSGDVYVNFTKTTSTPIYTTAGGAQTSEDIQQNISNSAGQIADNTAAIDGTLKQLIQHISDQLHALWDQMYNYMHVPLVNNDNARTQRIIDRMDEGFDINVEVLDRNFHDLMENDDKNTDQITNGYDNSTFNSANSQLDSSVNQYDQAETGIFDSVKENVTGFTIPDFTSNVQVLTAVGFCSNYLQRLFNAIGLYNLPITVSLVMIFVLMVLGYYRVRS